MKFIKRVTITQVRRQVRLEGTPPAEQCPQCGFDLTHAEGLKPLEQVSAKLVKKAEASKVGGER